MQTQQQQQSNSNFQPFNSYIQQQPQSSSNSSLPEAQLQQFQQVTPQFSNVSQQNHFQNAGQTYQQNFGYPYGVQGYTPLNQGGQKGGYTQETYLYNGQNSFNNNNFLQTNQQYQQQQQQPQFLLVQQQGQQFASPPLKQEEGVQRSQMMTQMPSQIVGLNNFQPLSQQLQQTQQQQLLPVQQIGLQNQNIYGTSSGQGFMIQQNQMPKIEQFSGQMVQSQFNKTSEFDKKNVNQNKNWVQKYLTYPSIQKLLQVDQQIYEENQMNSKKDKNNQMVNFHLDFLDFMNCSEQLFQLKPYQKLDLPSLPNSNKSQNGAQSNSQSKFRNKNKLLLTKILKFFSLKNLNCLQMPPQLRQQLVAFAAAIKESGKALDGKNVKKSDLFNHSHYNIMFLKLSNLSIPKLIGNKLKDVGLHQQIFKVDIQQYYQDFISANEETEKNKKQQPQQNKSEENVDNNSTHDQSNSNTESDQQSKNNNNNNEQKQKNDEKAQSQGEFEEQIQFVNFIKECFFQITNTFLKSDFVGEDENDNVLEEREYEYRAFTAIQQMNKGRYILRF